MTRPALLCWALACIGLAVARAWLGRRGETPRYAGPRLGRQRWELFSDF